MEMFPIITLGKQTNQPTFVFCDQISLTNSKCLYHIKSNHRQTENSIDVYGNIDFEIWKEFGQKKQD